MRGPHPPGDRATGAVPPLLLVVGGLLLTLVAVLALVLQLRASGPGAAGTGQPPLPVEPAATSTQGPTTATSPEAATSTQPPRHRRTASPSGTAAPAEHTGAPTWVTIASGGIDAPLVPQGLAADGTINPGREEVIWFTGADRVAPGQVGTSVIAGHVTWEGAPDAFVDLPSVRVGDTVTIGYEDGSSESFTVTSAAAVDKDELARSLTVWGPQPDRPRLAIITCDPVLGYQADGHTQANFVVIAEG